MKKFTDFLDKYLSPVADKLSNNRFLKSIADGVIMTMPLTMIAAVFSIINSLPNILPFLPDWSPEVASAIMLPYNLLFGLLALIISFTVAKRHAKYYELNETNCGIVSLICFVLIASPLENNTFDATFFGYAGIFSAVITGLVSVEIYRFLVQRNIKIKMPDSVPPLVSSSFETIVPLFILISVFYLGSLACQEFTGMLIPAWIQQIVTPAIQGGDTITYQVAIHFFMQLFFWLGMHGWAILAGIMMPIQTALLAEQSAAAAAGQALPYITPGGANFMGTFWWFLPIMLIFFCKAKRNKAIGKAGLVPGIFGISEPVTFGTPIVLNPILGIPFILFHPICVAINFGAIKLGFMNASATPQISGVPQPFATWIACDGDLRVFLVFAVILLVTFLIWYPFLKVWDNKCLREEHEMEEQEHIQENVA
ncbi:PTS sugar transporter subunit IIC [Breznakia pachnodae]|uniref:Permease IIC component n=1 Tax=Breznakia pachnodae TaxID=265178 RepID=A0ABU0DZY7_9FIRM|nr:PTS transporter subunit EIIC [Breznakia pachnodae]MDQ0360212.1 PTS system cellobiose-specific IIC component [Breznakia pachnodae]